MPNYAVKLLKDTVYPVKIPEGISVKNGDKVLVKTEKGEEEAVLFLLSSEISNNWTKHNPDVLTVTRVLKKENLIPDTTMKADEEEAFKIFKDLAGKLNPDMSPVKCSYNFDKSKVTFYYTAPERVDFRNLLKELTYVLKKVRIDLRHIGVRDETAICKGNGICGRPFCCCTFKRKFESINIKCAREQGIPANPGKVSGTCGRLMCCLNYEYDDYVEAAKDMPPVGSGVMTPDGPGCIASVNLLNGKISVKLQDEKLKDYVKDEIEIIDTDLNINLGISDNFEKNEDD